MKIKSGGGISSNKTVQSKSGWKREPVSKAQSVEAVAQQGAALAFNRKPLVSGKGYTPGPQGDAGSRSYFNAAKEGPGSGRTIFKAGTQSATPAPKELPKGRDILGAYGPERSRGGG
jgi:hypothetical protein